MAGDGGKRRFPILKVILRLLGALSSALFAWQGIWLAIHPTMDDFWEGCHWLGQILLAIIVGFIGAYFEIRGGMQRVAKNFKWYALNRIGLSLFYFWLGCYVMGGMGLMHTGEGWRTLSHATGILAWVTSVGDLIISCMADKADEDEDGFADKNGASPSSSSPTLANGQAPPANTYGAQDIQWATTGGPSLAAAAPDPTSPCGGAWGEGTSSPFEQGGGTSAEDVGFSVGTDQAAGWNDTTWNSAGGKPFGAS